MMHWDELSSFPPITTITRYFRKSIILDKTSGYYSIKIGVTTTSGFVAYLNGKELFSWGMPNTPSTPTTLSLLQTDHPVEHFFSSLLQLFTSSETKTVIAVEVHASSFNPFGEETFDTSAVFGLVDDDRRIDVAGSLESIPSTTGVEGAQMAFDDNVNTKWCYPYIPHDECWLTWSWNNDRRELINKYSISTANDEPGRDPTSWTVEGSNDKVIWNMLDVQLNVRWDTRFQTKSFVMNNYLSFSSYRLTLTGAAGLAGMIQFSEWNLMLSNQVIIPPGISYPHPTYIISKGIDEVNITPTVTGYTAWRIDGPNDSTLPSGLMFAIDSGVITGMAVSVMKSTVFTVSAEYRVDMQRYTTTLDLTVLACDPPAKVYVRLTKTNTNLQTEHFELLTTDGSVLLRSDPDSTTPLGMCLDKGTYNVRMTQSSGTTWQSNSYLTVEYLESGSFITTTRARLTRASESMFAVAFDIVLPPADFNDNLRYIADTTVPSGWWIASHDDSGWQTVSGLARPNTTSRIQFFRTTIQIGSKEGYNGVQIRVKAKAGVLIFLNNIEIYRSFLPSGDITPETTPEGGQKLAFWRSLTADMSSILVGVNTLAVAIVNINQVESPIDFDISSRLIKSSKTFPRYFNILVTGQDAQNLFDLNKDSHIMISKASNPSPSITLQYTEENVEAITKYCFITNYNMPENDPKEWTVSASYDGTTFIVIDEQVDIYFMRRSAEYCFFIPVTNWGLFSFYKLRMTDTASGTANSFYSLSQWNLYLEDLRQVILPELSFSPSALVGYTGELFPLVTANSPYYSHFTVVPPLPTGLMIDKFSGVITGILFSPHETSHHTISARNHLGEISSTTITLTVNTCTGDRVPFSIEFQMKSGASSYSFDLIELENETVVESRDSFIDDTTSVLFLCRQATLYALVLKHTDTTGWGSSKVVVKLSDNTILLSESLASGSSSKKFPFNVAYTISPRFTPWKYSITGNTVPLRWNTIEGIPMNWPEAMPMDMPSASSISQYYVRKFSSGHHDLFSVMDIAVMVRAGAIIYLNGREILRRNMPENEEITALTEATREETSAIRVATAEFIQRGLLKEGENILAVELHRYKSNELSNSFDASALLILDGMYMVVDGTASSLPEKTDFEGINSLFDNDVSTKTLLDGGCRSEEVQWTYNQGRKEVISSYSLVSANDCLQRSPSGWRIEGSNDGEQWIVLHERKDMPFTAYFQEQRFDFYNEVPYNMYKMVVIQCNSRPLNNVNCGVARMQLSEFYLFSKRLQINCAAIGEYPPALNGDISIISCPALYDGKRYRICADNAYGDEINNCIPAKPVGIMYDMTEFNFTKGEEIIPIKPQIIAKEFKVSIFPSLSPGIQLDIMTGEIFGKPTEIQGMRRHTVSVKNDSGSTMTYLLIAVDEPPTNWILITVIAVVVAILVVLIVLAIIFGMKKKKKTMKTEKKAKVKVSTEKVAIPTVPVKIKADIVL